MLWHRGMGENRLRFAEERQSKPFMHTHNMQESQYNAADLVGLMRESGYRVCRFFALYREKGHLRRDDLFLKIGSTAQEAVINSLSL